MINKIVHDKNFLHKKTTPVDTIQEGEQIADKLLSVLKNFPYGVGLSANQIGIPKSVSVVRIPSQEPLVLINPIIVDASPETVVYREGCLSIPGKVMWTKRHIGVKISTLNHANVLEFIPDVIPMTAESVEKDYGLLKSVCVQHEIDHLNGRLISDEGIRVIPPAAVAGIKYGRNDKVVIEKDGQTQFIKYKNAIPLIENSGWKLI